MVEVQAQNQQDIIRERSMIYELYVLIANIRSIFVTDVFFAEVTKH